jgi:glycosyltransferase involved in cell wall biosynthesis
VSNAKTKLILMKKSHINNLAVTHLWDQISVHRKYPQPGTQSSEIEISILLPTRNRPNLLKQFLDSVVKNTENLSQIEIVLYIDDDDMHTQELDYKDLNITRLIGPRLTMGAYNYACLKYSVGNIIILANDDVIIHTPGWDVDVMKTIIFNNDKIFLAYPNDTIMVKGCSFPILSRKTCNILIQPFPVEYKRLFIDIHLMDIFKRLAFLGENRIHYLENIVFEHLRNKLINENNIAYHQRYNLEDDIAFLSLRYMRMRQAQRLYAAIKHEVLPALQQQDEITTVPKYFTAALWTYFTGFILDYGLPLRRRFSFFYWFIGHYAMTRTWLGLCRSKASSY